MTTGLSPGGTLAAIAVGAVVAISLGWAGLALLCAFFLSSTLLTPGGGGRRAAQVIANGGVAAAATLLALARPWGAAMVGIGGFAGCLADSFFGATLQARYRCPACGAAGETPRRCCGQTPDLAGGLRWMTNDTVNLLATMVGAGVAVLPVVAGVAPLPLI